MSPLLRPTLTIVALATSVTAFAPPQLCLSSSTALFARPGLQQLLNEDGDVEKKKKSKVRTRSTRLNNKSKKKATKKEKATEGAVISPALAQWMADRPEGDDEDAEETTFSAVDDEDDDSASTFVSFEEDSKPKDRRVKQGVRMQLERKRAEDVKEAVKKFESTVTDSSNNLEDILGSIRDILTTYPSVNLKTVTAISGKTRNNFRLAWVGSDDAISHVGTGLHKVPLARLQEIFLTCAGQNRLELYEIIRILGPFPNVRNTLLGKSVVKSTVSAPIGESEDKATVAKWNIVMNSMIDGTGKELLADKDRVVSLQVYFAVAVVPPEDGSLRKDPLEENGKNVLVFTREEEMDEKLDALRVS